MLRRLQQINLPIEVLRTVAAIVDIGSFTKAGEKLGLSQPAISAQMKRLQILVGGPIFSKVTIGVTLNDRGKQLLPYIRRMLEINDQILSICGATQDSRPARLGLSSFYVERFLRQYKPHVHGEVSILADHSNNLIKGFADGYIDIACLLGPPLEAGTRTATWKEQLAWARSREFSVSLGAPIPIIGFPCLLTDQVAVQLLEASGLAYRVAFSSSDHRARLSAAHAGLGLLLLPESDIMEPLVEAREFYLPSVPPVEAGVIVRRDFKARGIGALLELLASLGDPSLETPDDPGARTTKWIRTAPDPIEEHGTVQTGPALVSS